MPRSKRVFGITPAYIEWIHDSLIRLAWPGVGSHMKGVYRDRAMLESAADRPFQTAFGRDIHRGVHAKGSALFHSLISNHPFGDGNKRTAVTSLLHFMIANGLILFATQDVMYKLAMTTATAGERFVRQDETLMVIKKTLIGGTVKLSEIRKFKEFDEVYREARKAMRSVRNNSLNRRP